MEKYQDIKSEMVAIYRQLEAGGYNRSASGNISVRVDDRILITPTAIAADKLTPDTIVDMPMDASQERDDLRATASTEWPFHSTLLRNRRDIDTVIHTHAPFCTILSVARIPIPAIHYMIAAFGGADIRVADYARYGTEALAENIFKAMQGRNGCLMANHGMVVAGTGLGRTRWLACEMEALAHQHYHTLTIGGGHVLTDAEIEDTLKGFAGYGVQSSART